MSAYILVNVLIPVVYVISHSVSRVVWKNIDAYTLASVLIHVVYAISHSLSMVVWRNINAYMLMSCPNCVSYVIQYLSSTVPWRTIGTCIPLSVLMPLMPMINHSTSCAFSALIRTYVLLCSHMPVVFCVLSACMLNCLLGPVMCDAFFLLIRFGIRFFSGGRRNGSNWLIGTKT